MNVNFIPPSDDPTEFIDDLRPAEKPCLRAAAWAWIPTRTTDTTAEPAPATTTH